MSRGKHWVRFLGQGKANVNKGGKRRTPQRTARLGIEALESREMLSGLSITAPAGAVLSTPGAVVATTLTSTSLSTSWPAPVNGVTWNVNVAINGTLLAGTPRTGVLSLSSNGTVLASLNIATATPPSGTTVNYYTLTVPGGLPLGLNQLRIDYSGDANYAAASYTATLTIHNDNLSFSYSTQALIGQPYTVNAAIVGPIIGGAARTGVLALVEGANTLASVNVAQATPNSNGYYPLVVSAGLSAGVHNLKVNYTGDAVYDALSLSLNPVNVVSTLSTSTYLSGSTQVASGQATSFTATVSASGATVNAGTVTLLDGTTVLGTAPVSNSGSASFTGIVLNGIGTHTLTAKYGGSTSFNASTSSAFSVKAVGALTSLTYNWPAPYTSQAWTPNVGLSGTLLTGVPRTGVITLSEGTTTLASVNIATATPSSNGYYALAVPGGLAAGSHTLKFAYSGDANYGTSSATITITVRNDALSVGYSSSALVGVPYTVRASITGPLVGGAARSGTLTLLEGTTTLATVDVATATTDNSGYYLLTVTGGLTAGQHTGMKVVYSGDTVYDAVTATLGTVTASTTLATSTYLNGPTQVLSGQSASFSASVSASGTRVNAGTVTLLDGTTVLGTAAVSSTGTASFSGIVLDGIGTHALTASYSGATSFNPSTSAALNVKVIGATTSLMYNWPAPYTNQSWTVNVGLSGTLLTGIPRTGVITLSEGTTTLASVNIATATPNTSGYFALTIPAGLSGGAHTLKFAYSGDANYGSASATTTITVRNDNLSLSYYSSTLAGQPYTVRAMITGPLVGGAARTGTLTLVEGTTTLATVNLATATPDNSGYYALTVASGLTAGTHTGMKVLYSGDVVYDAVTYTMGTVTATSTLSTSTSLSGPTQVVAGQAVNFAANVSAPGTPVNAGTVTLLEGTTVLGTATISSTGAASFTGIVLNGTGTHTLTARYEGTTSFNPSTSSAWNVKVVGALTGLMYNWPTPYTNQSWTVNVGLSGTLLTGVPRTGVITLSEGTTTLGSVDIATAPSSANGYFALAVPAGLSAGAHTLKFTYSGDANYGSSSAMFSLTVRNDALALGYSSSALVGQSYAVRAAITGPLVGGAARTGTLTLVDGSTTLATLDVTAATPDTSGYYTLTVANGLTAGTHTGMKVLYSGDTVYDAVSTTMGTVTVASALATTTNLNGPTQVVSGQAASFRANVSAAGKTVNAGTVTLLDGTTVLGTAAVNSSGVASFTGIALSGVGTHALTARYGGAPSFNPSTSTTLNVKAVGATTSLVYNWPAPYTNQSWTASVGLNGTLLAGLPRTGVITLSEGATTLASVNIATATPNTNGYYALAVPAGFSSGAHTLKFAYSGDANYGSASATISITVRNDALSVSYSSAALVGQPYTVRAAVTGPLVGGAARTGTLTLVEGATTLATVDLAAATPDNSGYYALTVASGLTAGTHTGMKVIYSGDTVYDAVSFSMATVTASSTLSTNTSLSGPLQVVSGQPVSFTANVSAPGTPVNAGTVTLLEGTTVLGTATVSSTGLASFTGIVLNGIGTHALTASYSGATTFNPSTSAVVNVKAVGALTSLMYNWPAPYTNQSWTVKVGLNGTLLSGVPRTGQITLSEGNTTLASVNVATATPNSSGYYALTMPAGLSVGTHTLKFAYTGDANYGSASATISLTVRNDALSVSYYTSALAGQPYTVRAAVTGPLVGGAARTGTLTLVEGTTTLATVNLAAATPDGSNYYSLTVPGGLSAGAHTGMKVLYSGDAVYDAVTYTLGTITAASNLSTTTYLSGSTQVAAGQAVNYSVSVSAPGATVNAGTVTLFDGTTAIGTAAVSSTGTASFTGIVLHGVGTHVLTASYAGSTAFNPSTSSALNVKVVGALCSVGCSYPAPLANQPWTLKAAINGTVLTGTPRTGTLTLSSGSTVLASVDVATATRDTYGYYSLAVPGGLPLGTNTLKVAYSGDANYGSASNTLTLNVTNVTLGLSYSNTAVAGNPYTVNATLGGPLVSGAARTGTLTLMEGTTVLATIDITKVTPNPNGSLPVVVTAGLTAGTHSLKMVYSGDAVYSSLTVNMATITVSLPA